MTTRSFGRRGMFRPALSDAPRVQPISPRVDEAADEAVSATAGLSPEEELTAFKAQRVAKAMRRSGLGIALSASLAFVLGVVTVPQGLLGGIGWLLLLAAAVGLVLAVLGRKGEASSG